MAAKATVPSKSRILLVEDHPLMRHGLAQLINEENDLAVCGEAEDANQAMAAVATLVPDLVILDISLKGSNGLDLIRDLCAQHPRLAILVLSMHKESLYGERALRAGARGYIMKQEATDRILTAIRRVLGGDLYVSEWLASRMIHKLVREDREQRDGSLESLTDREFEIFTMIGKGWGPTQMAEKLKLSVKTVETHREHIKEKLKLKNGAELVRCALRHAMGEDIHAEP